MLTFKDFIFYVEVDLFEIWIYYHIKYNLYFYQIIIDIRQWIVAINTDNPIIYGK